LLGLLTGGSSVGRAGKKSFTRLCSDSSRM